MDGQTQRGILDNLDAAVVQQIQGEINKLNPSVLRGIEGGALHFIPIARSTDQEYIDHTLLNPEYITAHLQNGVVVDILQNQPNNYAAPSPNYTIIDRHFVNEADLVTQIAVQPSENNLVNDSDRKVAQAFLQYVHKHGGPIPQIVTNETQVIVPNKYSEHHLPPLTKIPKAEPIKECQSVVLPEKPIQILKMELELDGKSDDDDFYDESDSDNESLTSIAALVKTNLPHKKRISTKLKTTKTNYAARADNAQNSTANAYKCELCGLKSENQLTFFTHLKQHYEPINSDVKTENASTIENFQSKILTLQPSNNCNTITLTTSDETLKNSCNEFSDTEDMLEGIRGVVDKVQESVDNDLNNEQLSMKDWDIQNLSSNIVYHDSTSLNNNSNVGSDNDILLYYDKNSEEHAFKDIEPTTTSILREHLLKSSSPKSDDLEPMDCDESKKFDENLYFPKMSFQDIELEFTEEITEISDTEGKSKRKKKMKSYKCKRCNKVCNSKNALHYHFLSHTGERPHQCEVCGKSFFAGSALKVHKRLHSGDKPYNCNFCSRAFRQWGDLKYHITSLHTEEKNHQCEFCGKDFSRRYSLVIHRRIHTGERNYKCEYCSKTFRASSYLQDHRKIHTGEKPHACAECPKKFRVRGDLNRHLKIHERSKVLKTKKIANIAEQVGPFTGDQKKDTQYFESIKYENSLDLIYSENEPHIYQVTNENCTQNRKNQKESITNVKENAHNKTVQQNSKKGKTLANKAKKKIVPLPNGQTNTFNNMNDSMKAKDFSEKYSQIETDPTILLTHSMTKNLSKPIQIVDNTQNWTVNMDKSTATTTTASIITSDETNGHQQFVVWPIDVSYIS